MRSPATSGKTLFVVAAVVGLLGVDDGPLGDDLSPTKIHSYSRTGSEKAAYTVRVDSPWRGGGQLHVNFPEHLEYGPVGYTITRYHDPRPPAWRVEREGKFAHYEVDSMPGRGVEGVKVRASAQVIEPNRVRLSLKIINNSDKMLHDVKPLLCFQYKDLVGFPRGYEENFRYTYVILDGRVTALADVQTEKADAAAKAAPVKGVKPYRFDFSKNRGGFIDKPLDLGLSAITSKDGARAVILYAPVGKSVLSNLHIPCLHADPHFGHVKPGETKERIVNVIFAGADWRGVVERITKQHAQGVFEQTDPKPIEGRQSRSQCELPLGQESTRNHSKPADN
ncbi:MAG: hypothetical protein ACYTG0_17425 [Planctomycetota bacterium]|jgi:hypothetical protein